MMRQQKFRQVGVPCLMMLLGILLGSSWTYMQFQLSTTTTFTVATTLPTTANSNSKRSPFPSTPLCDDMQRRTSHPDDDIHQPHSDASPLPELEPLERNPSVVSDDTRRLYEAQWASISPTKTFISGLPTRSGDVLLDVAPGVIPVRPLRAPSALPQPHYAKTAEELVLAMKQRQASSQSRPAHKPFSFHVYHLPEKYTTGALQLLEERWPTSFCNRHKVKTNFTMLDWKHAFSLFTTDVFITKYLRFHPSHTDDATEADVFIIPMMTHVYHCAGVNHYTIEVLSHIMQYQHYKAYHQHDHFLFWWRWGMHYNSVLKFWRRVTRFIPNVNIISFDYLEIMGRNEYQDFSLALKPKFLQTQHSIIMPYPDFSPDLTPVPVEREVVGTPRKIFFYFAGTSTIGGIRRWIKRNCEAAQNPQLCYYEDFAKNVIDSARLGIPKGYPAAMKNSLFCGHAAGDALSSRRPTSAVLATCIPVLICDLCLYAYENLIDYDTFAVFVSEDDVINGKLIQILQAIPQSKIESMQRSLLQVRSHFVYNTTSVPQPGDALDTLVAQLSLRGSVLRQYRRWFTSNYALSADMREYPVNPPAKKKYLMKGSSAEERDFNALG